MRRLLLLRHSKAVPYTGSDDHERALTARGRADAARLGAFIAGEKFSPRAAVHSGSRRTGETLDIVLGKLKGDLLAAVDPRLYEASVAAFLNVLRDRADEASPLLVVGHNPGIGGAARHLAAAGDRGAPLIMAEKFPTSALAIIDFETDHWRGIAEGRLVRFVTPASLGGDDD